MIGGAFIMLIVYGLIAYAAYINIFADQFAGSDIPYYILVEKLFGTTGKLIITVLAITASCSTLNTAIATVPRMLFGMANNNQLPPIFANLHPRTKTPWFGLLFFALIILIPTVLLKDSKGIFLILMISAAVLWLLAHIIVHLDVIILRIKYPKFHRPFKSPWFPIPQIVGIVGMAYLVDNNSPSPEMTSQVYINFGIFIGITGLFTLFLG